MIAQEEFPRWPARSAQQIWRTHVKARHPIRQAGPDFVAGFFYPDEGGRWTEGYRAIMTCPDIAAVGTRTYWRLTFIPLLTDTKRSLTFAVCGGKGLTTRMTLTSADPVPFVLDVDADVVGNDRSAGVVLAFDLADAARPRLLGLSADNRLLGLFIQSVEKSDGPRPQG